MGGHQLQLLRDCIQRAVLERPDKGYEGLNKEGDSSGGAPELPLFCKCLELQTQTLVRVIIVHTLNGQGDGGNPHDRICRLQIIHRVDEARE